MDRPAKTPVPIIEMYRMIAERAENKLSEKYGGSFSIYSMGDAVGTGHMRLYAYPDTDEELRFAAYVYPGSEAVDDELPLRAVTLQLEREISAGLEAAGIRCRARIDTRLAEKADIPYPCEDAAAALKKIGEEPLPVYLVTEDGSADGDKLKEVFAEIYDRFGKELAVCGYCFAPEVYPEAENAVKIGLSVTEAEMKTLGYIARFYIYADESGTAFREDEEQRG